MEPQYVWLLYLWLLPGGGQQPKEALYCCCGPWEHLVGLSWKQKAGIGGPRVDSSRLFLCLYMNGRCVWINTHSCLIMSNLAISHILSKDSCKCFRPARTCSCKVANYLKHSSFAFQLLHDKLKFRRGGFFPSLRCVKHLPSIFCFPGYSC